MSKGLEALIARGGDCHQVIANNQLGWSFTISTSAAAATATTACLPILGDPSTAGRSAASTLAATISTASNLGIWSLRLNNSIFSSLGTPVKYDLQIAQTGNTNAAHFACIVTEGQSRLDFRLFTMTTAGGVPAVPSTETFFVTVIARGWANNTGLPV